jgi:hypothetical protein
MCIILLRVFLYVKQTVQNTLRYSVHSDKRPWLRDEFAVIVGPDGEPSGDTRELPLLETRGVAAGGEGAG